MNRKFLMSKLSVKNFRGYENQVFNFFENKESKKGLILLGGPNGYGKTTVLDAFEWCLTGTVKRLEEEYESRSKKDKSQTMQLGLLRNGSSKEEVVVEIEGTYGEDAIYLKRVFNGKNEKEGLSLAGSPFEVRMGNSLKIFSTIDDVVEKEVSKYFYERHICSYEKNIKIYQKSREDIYNMFSYFFGGTDEIETILKNLEGYEDKKNGEKFIYEGVIKTVSNELEIIKKSSVEKLNLYNELKLKIDEHRKQGENKVDLESLFNKYPKEKIYQTEKNTKELFDLIVQNDIHKNQLNDQKINLNKVFQIVRRQQVIDLIINYVDYLKDKMKFEEFEKEIYLTYKENIHYFQKISGKDKLAIEKQNVEYKNIQRIINSISSFSEQAVNQIQEQLVNPYFINEVELHQMIKELKNRITESLALESKLSVYKNNDPVIQSLRAIVDHLNGFTMLSHEVDNCPLCGSDERFSKENIELGIEAKNRLGNYDETRAKLQGDYNALIELNRKQFDRLMLDFKKKLLGEIEIFNDNMNAFIVTEPIIVASKRFEIDVKNINLEEVNKLREQLKPNSIIEFEFLQTELQIIRLIDDGDGNLNDIFSITNKDRFISKSEFDSSNTRDKLNMMESYISNYELLTTEVKNKIGEIEKAPISLPDVLLRMKLLEQLENEVNNDLIMKETQGKMKKAETEYNVSKDYLHEKEEKLKELKKILSNTKQLRKEFDDEIVKDISEPLQKIYKRLNRHTNIQAIDLTREGKTNTKAKLNANMMSNDKVYVPNVLSTGQISVVSLAIYLTIAMGQKENPFRCYFMDDPIQTMDDLNILSFVDLIRTELTHNTNNPGFLDQLFITTCDEDLEQLIAFKMKHFGVNYSHLHFNGYGKYEVLG
ncbi:hypothetical protein R50345_08795 [Paenibacillus sp. FSL R5-0345]|uniref:AAA family ATPase n=1 Tax=Paenibacillus sp. FSL R5-0345 TaxID=1536770 RepID=UPI0004F90066|nr:AAA family ATPase [Paenibacillus sp. FSL R5-0345]AIQ34700.1 hypothetical protein R50345_08795 [Paenibacillus sp. FSL R5-0345]